VSASHSRRAERHAIAIPIEVTIAGQTVSGQTRNLSIGGAFIEAERTPAFGTRVVLTFKLSTLPQVIEVGGTVRWTDAGGFGVMFDGLHARDVFALNKLFEKLPRE